MQRLDRITTTLLQDLGDLLASLISPEPPTAQVHSNAQIAAERHKLRLEALMDCFRTYASIGRYREAEEVLRKQMVSQVVNKTIYREALLSPQSPMLPATPFPHTGSIDSMLAGAQKGSHHTAFPFDSVDGLSSITDPHVNSPYHIEPISLPLPLASVDTSLSDALIDLYNKLLTFISKDLGDILNITERKLSHSRDRQLKIDASRTQVFGALGITSTMPDQCVTEGQPRQGFEVLSSVIFAEIAQRLNNELSHLLFSAGRTDTFHRNYMATRLFIDRIEGLCPTIRHLTSLRQSTEYVAFMRRWQLPVYFQLRFKEVVGALESTLRTATVSAAPTAVLSATVVMSSTDASLRAIKSCWNPDIYIPELSGRFWRLTLQLLARHKTWLQSHLPEYSLAANNVSQGAAAENANPNGSASALNRLLPVAISSRPATPNTQPSNATEDAADDELLRKASIIVADIMNFQTAVMTFYGSGIRPKLPDLGDDTCERSMRQVLEEIGSFTPELHSAVVSVLIKRCSEPLRLVRTGASQTRNTSSYGSTEMAPSYFISNILRPSKAFVEGPGRLLLREVQLTLVASVFEEVANRYEASLTKMKKDGDALRRLKKGRQGFQLFGSRSAPPADKGPSAEDELVKSQLHADVEAFADDAISMGIDLSRSEALGALRLAVRNWMT